MVTNKAVGINYEDVLDKKLGDLGFQPAVRQFRLLKKGVLDFAWPDKKVAVEVNGGQWLRFGGRHNRDKDRMRNNGIAAEGWFILIVTPDMIRDEQMFGQFIIDLKKALTICENGNK